MLRYFTLLVCIFSSAWCAKLNMPKVLLPYHSSMIANVTLEVEYLPEESQAGSCYEWRSTRPEVAQIRLLNSTDGHCSNLAQVSAVSKTKHQMTTVVIAENKMTGEILRCNVIVAEIALLEIETTTRMLYLEDSPEELLVRGYDSEGNAFTNLHGLSFEWRLVSDTEFLQDSVIDAHNILRIKRFADSDYTTPPHIVPLEERGQQGDMILVEGLRTGSAKVSARLRDLAYKTLKPCDVRIMVVANLMLSPPDAYVLKYATVKYRVEVIKQNSITEIPMPSSQYYLEVKDGDVCTLDTHTSLATALDLGSTEIILKDRNIISTEFFREPSAMLHVVNPNYLTFVVLPTKLWVLEAGRHYDIIIEVYDKDSHKLHPSDNVRINAKFSEKYFKVQYSSENGTYHHVIALVRGMTFIDGVLTTVIREDGTPFEVTPEVRGRQEVEIYDRLVLSPKALYFPWDPVSQCKHRYHLQVSGGSGDYVWSSADTRIAQVNVRGDVSTAGLGTVTVTASDTKNSFHFDTAMVHVLPPEEMNFLPSRVEAPVGSVLELLLRVSARLEGNTIYFTDCHQLPMNVTFSDGAVFEQVKGRSGVTAGSGQACVKLRLTALHRGFTEVLVSHRSGGVQLKASITIAAYDPLEAVDPEKEVLVAVGSTQDVVFRGGPQPWILDPSKYFQHLTNEKDNAVCLRNCKNKATDRNYHSFALQCQNYGEQQVSLQVGNNVTAKNPFPAAEEVSIKFICARPVSLQLQPIFVSNPSLPPCPITHETHLPMPVHCRKLVKIQVIVKDSEGRRFSNFSSLAFRWSLSNHDLVAFPHPQAIITDLQGDEAVKVPLSYKELQPKGMPGSVEVGAAIEGYNNAYLVEARSHITAKKFDPPIKQTVELQLVEEATIQPSHISIFNHPSNKVLIDVKKGSGYFFMEEITTDVMSANYDAKKRGVRVNPVKDGSHSFTVYDLCLNVDVHPSATVSISGIGTIQIRVVDKVEVTKEVMAQVQVLDMQGIPLLSSFFPLMGLTLQANSDIVSIRPATVQTDDQVTAYYTVYGAVVGHTTLTAHVTLPSKEVITSAPKPLEVFPPLRLEARNITLIIGAKYQVLATGGPQPQSSVEFSILNSDIASISSFGLVHALELGTTRVLGRAVGSDTLTGDLIIYSQDEVTVNVVPLTGIRIHAPLTRLQTGTRMPVYAVGVTEHETPFTFGSADPPLNFHWTLSSGDVAQLQSIYHQSKLQLPPAGNFAQQLLATAAGQVTLKLEVRGQHRSQLQGRGVLQDEVQLHVFESLKLVQPPFCHSTILMTPNTETVIKTNRDTTAKVSYSVLKRDGDAVVTLLEGGTLLSGSVPGTAALHLLAEEEFGVDQTLVVQVKVKPISYLMLSADTVLHTAPATPLSAIPVGSTIDFSVSFHDDVGETFYATNTELGIRSSRYDMVHVNKGLNNNTLTVRAVGEGQSVLKGWDKQSAWIADYIAIPVGPAISPAHSTVSLGSIVCFSCPLVSSTGQKGVWHSRHSAVAIEMESGLASAVGVGTATITYNVSTSVVTHTQLRVERIPRLKIGEVPFLTNALPQGRNIHIPVSLDEAPLSRECQQLVTAAKYQPPVIPFSCQLELTVPSPTLSVTDLFSVSAVFNSKKGQYGCSVSSVDSNPEQAASTLASKLALRVTLHDSFNAEDPQPVSATFNFIPAFYVHNSGVHLTTVAPLASLRLTALPSQLENIRVTVSDPLLIEVLAPEQDSQVGSIVVFPVRLLDSLSIWERENLDLHLDVVSVVTNQKALVPVTVKVIGQKPSISRFDSTGDVGWGTLVRRIINNNQSWFVICIIILLTAAAVLLGYHAVLSPRVKSSVGYFGPNPPLMSSSSPSFVQQSPLGSPSYTPGPSPSSPRLWSVSPSRMNSAISPRQRSPFSPHRM